MKKLLLILTIALTAILTSYGQTGTGWLPVRAKQNFRDSTNFNRGFKLSGTQVTTNAAEFNILDGALISTAELNRLVGTTNPVQSQINTINSSISSINTSISGINTRLNDSTTLDYEINARTASYTLVLTDNWKVVTMNSASATTLTVPTNASVAFPVGASITICCIGSGQTTVSPASGVTILSRSSYTNITILGDATLIKLGTNTWKLIGSLE